MLTAAADAANFSMGDTLLGWLIGAAALLFVSTVAGSVKTAEDLSPKAKDALELLEASTKIAAAFFTLVGFALEKNIGAVGVGLIIFTIAAAGVGVWAGFKYRAFTQNRRAVQAVSQQEPRDPRDYPVSETH